MSAFVPLVGASPLTTRTPRALTTASARTTLLPIAPVFVRAPAPVAAPERQSAGTGSGGGPQAPGARPARVLVVLDGALRVTDNAALVGALRASRGPGGVLVPLACVDGAHKGAIAELASDLIARGSALVGVRGDVVSRALDACKRLRLGAVYVNRAASATVARMQRRLRDAASHAGIEFVAFGACGLAADASRVPDSLPVFRKEFNANSVPAPLEAPERLPALPAEAGRIGVDVVAGMGKGTKAAVQVLQGMVKEKELRRVKVGMETVVMLGGLLECGAVSEAMVAGFIVRKVGALKGATYEELMWRSYVCACYEKKEKVGATGSLAKV